MCPRGVVRQRTADFRAARHTVRLSRSIRGTHKRLEKLETQHYADERVHDELLHETRRRIQLQDRVKRRVRNTRREAQLTIPALVEDALPIEIVDGGAYRQPAFTADELRDLMRRFPPSALDGLGVVRLRPASPYEYRARFGSYDPHTNTRSREVFPGVWGPMLRGRYGEHARSIDVYTHIHAPGISAAATALIKLRTLHTFAHEASHHYDFMFRTRGDRWLMDHPRDELYATSRAYNYVCAFVVPWLQEKYPTECAALQAWVSEHGGAPMRLALFADERAGQSSPLADAFDELVDDVIAGRDAATTKVTWARALHETLDSTRDACHVLDGVLALQPDHSEALVVRAGIDCRQGRYQRAETTLRAVLAREVQQMDAWETLLLVYHSQRRWQDMAAAATDELAVRIAEDDWPAQAREHRAQAWLILERWDLLEAEIATMRASEHEAERDVGDVYQALLQCWRGQFAEALALSTRLLQDEYRDRDHASVMRVVRFASAHRLGRPQDAGRWTRADVTLLLQVLPTWQPRLEQLLAEVAQHARRPTS